MLRRDLVDVATARSGADIGVVVLGTKENVRGVVSERDLVRAAADRRDFDTTASSSASSLLGTSSVS